MEAYIRVGGKIFMFPASRVEKIKKWASFEIGIMQGTIPVPVVDRDPQIFAFIHRWLCGYPAHLPPTEWEIICLMADCAVYGVDELHSELVEQLKDQDSNLGRKATLIMSDYHPKLHQSFLTDSWEKILNILLADIFPSALTMVTELAQVMEESASDSVKTLAPFVKIVVLDKELFSSILKRLIKNYALSFPAELLDLVKTLLENQRKSKRKTKTRDIPSQPATDAAEDTPPPQDHDIENPPSPKRKIPPPSASPLSRFIPSKSKAEQEAPPPLPPQLLIAKLNELQGADDTGMRIYSPED